jgi:hypothetical protein
VGAASHVVPAVGVIIEWLNEFSQGVEWVAFVHVDSSSRRRMFARAVCRIAPTVPALMRVCLRVVLMTIRQIHPLSEPSLRNPARRRTARANASWTASQASSRSPVMGCGRASKLG